MVNGSNGSSDEWPNPENPLKNTRNKQKPINYLTITEERRFELVKLMDYLIIPGLLCVEYDSSSEASCWVNTSSGDGDCSQVNHEHCKSNWEWRQNLKKKNRVLVS